jgi:hypothetical protein
VGHGLWDDGGKRGGGRQERSGRHVAGARLAGFGRAGRPVHDRATMAGGHDLWLSGARGIRGAPDTTSDGSARQGPCHHYRRARPARGGAAARTQRRPGPARARVDGLRLGRRAGSGGLAGAPARAQPSRTWTSHTRPRQTQPRRTRPSRTRLSQTQLSPSRRSCPLAERQGEHSPAPRLAAAVSC